MNSSGKYNLLLHKVTTQGTDGDTSSEHILDGDTSSEHILDYMVMSWLVFVLNEYLKPLTDHHNFAAIQKSSSWNETYFCNAHLLLPAGICIIAELIWRLCKGY